MDQLRGCAGFALMAAMGIWGSIVFYDDVTHQERWDQDILHDPRAYWPLIVIVVGAGIAVFSWAFWLDWRDGSQ